VELVEQEQMDQELLHQGQLTEVVAEVVQIIIAVLVQMELADQE
jgi:hypothetical protein